MSDDEAGQEESSKYRIELLEHCGYFAPKRQCCDLCNCWIEWAVPSVIATGFGAALVNLFARAYMQIEEWQYTRSVYFTICTMTTLGYGDFAPESHDGRWVTIILIYASATFLMACFFYLAGAVVSIGPCIVLNCISGPFRECLNNCWKKTFSKEFNCCNCVVGDIGDTNWGVLEQIGKRIDQDDYYKELKKAFTVTMLHPGLSNDTNGIMSLSVPTTDKQKRKFVKFLNYNYSAHFEVESDDKERCCQVEKKCEKWRLACKPSACWAFGNISLMYVIWFGIWIGYFTGQGSGACKDGGICPFEVGNYTAFNLLDDGNVSVYSNNHDLSDITVFESVLEIYNVSLSNLSCVDLTDIPSSDEINTDTSNSTFLACDKDELCDAGEKDFTWQLAFYFGVVTSSTVGFGDYSGYGGAYKMSNKQIEFVTYMQVPGILLFAAWTAVFGGMYLQVVYALVIYLCCEPRGEKGRCFGCDIRCAWCVTVWDRMYYEKIVAMQNYYNEAMTHKDTPESVQKLFNGHPFQLELTVGTGKSSQKKIVKMNFGASKGAFHTDENDENDEKDETVTEICCQCTGKKCQKYCCCLASLTDNLQPKSKKDSIRNMPVSQHIAQDDE